MLGFGYFGYLIFMLPALLLGLFAQLKVKSAFNRYSKVASRRGMTGADAAKAVLSAGGVYNVAIGQVNGSLTDHYDPKNNRIMLSDSVHSSTSVAAIGVAAHEAGHALQYAEGYSPMKLRAAVIPVCNIGSFVGPILVVLGAAMTYSEGAIPQLGNLLYFGGIFLFSTVALFQLFTLPVELNASRRALKALESGSMLEPSELKGARSVLTAAALTYVAALVTAIMQILYYLSRFQRKK